MADGISADTSNTSGTTSGTTSGSSTSDTHASGTNTSTSNTNTTFSQLVESILRSLSLSSTTNNQNTINQGTTTGTSSTTSDATDIATGRGIVSGAMANASDDSMTNGIVSGILKKSALAFAPTEAQPNQAGIYDSTSLGLLKGNAEAQATADSAAAVLQYKTNQQQIANSGIASLLAATKNVTDATTNNSSSNVIGSTTGSTVTSQDTQSKTSSNQNVDVASLVKTVLDTLNKSTSDSKTNTTSDSTTNKAGFNLGTIICTELHMQGKLSTTLYRKNLRKFSTYPQYGRDGYHLWATPCVSHLRRYPDSLFSKLLLQVFTKRANGSKLANFLIELPSFLCGVYLLLSGKYSAVQEVKHG